MIEPYFALQDFVTPDFVTPNFAISSLAAPGTVEARYDTMILARTGRVGFDERLAAGCSILY